MKSILSIIVLAVLVVSGYSQTRNVLVGTNNSVVQPTNFWSADASNARTGLGLGDAATNPASAFQPASSVLTNLALSNGAGLTNISVTGVIGALPTNGDAIALTNFPDLLLRTNGNGSGLTNITASNVVGTVTLASNVVGIVSITNGGNGATTAGGARTNLGIGATNSAFTGLSVGTLNTNLSVDNSSAFGTQNIIDSSAEESFAFGAANKITNMPAGIGGSIVMGLLGNMTNQGAFLFNGVPQGGLAGNSRGNNTFAVNASNGIYLNGSLFLEAVQGVATGSSILQIAAGGAVTRTMTNKSTAVPAFFGWDGFENTAFSAAQARTNIGLSFAALTNTNTAGFNASLYGSGTNPVLYNTNGEVVSPTNFWQVAPIVTRFVEFDPATNATTNIVAARNLHIHSLAISRTGVTSTIALPTNNVFNGDIALVVHQGPTSSVTAIRTVGAGTNLVTLNKVNEAVEFVYYNNVWQFNHNNSFVEPIYFSGTNASANAAASRTNLGLGNIFTNVRSIFETNTSVFVNTNLTVTNGTGLFTNLQSQYLEFTTLFVGDSTNTNIIIFEDPTGKTNFIRNIGLGPTNNVAFQSAIFGGESKIDAVGISWSGTDLIELETRLFLGGTWTFDSGPIDISGASNKAITRTNLGLGLPALTNTNNATFQEAIFTTNAPPTNSAHVNAINFNTAVAWMAVNIVTNGVTNTFHVPLFK